MKDDCSGETFYQACVRVGGQKVGEKLLRDFGGRQIFIPTLEKLTSDSRFAQCVGYQTALVILQAVTAGDTGFHEIFPVKDPGSKLSYQGRQQLIDKLLSEGFSSNEIAAQANCSRRHVFRRKAELKSSDTKIERKIKTRVAEIRRLLIAGTPIIEIAEITKSPKIVVLAQKRLLVTEGKLS